MVKIIVLGPRSGHERNQRRGANAGQGAHPLQKRFVECVLLLGVVFFRWKAIAHRQDIVGHAAHIRRPQPPEALEQQPAAIRRTTVDRNLHRKQRLAQRGPPLAAGLLRAEACSAAIAPLPWMRWPAAVLPAAPRKNQRQAKASTTPSTWMALRGGKIFPGVASQRVAANDSRRRHAAGKEISRLSISCSRTSVNRAPQRAADGDLLLPRSDRATSRLATFRQPISSMQPTAPSSRISGFLTSWRGLNQLRDATSSATGASRYCKCIRYCTASTWLRALARLTSGLRRATTRLK